MLHKAHKVVYCSGFNKYPVFQYEAVPLQVYLQRGPDLTEYIIFENMVHMVLMQVIRLKGNNDPDNDKNNFPDHI